MQYALYFPLNEFLIFIFFNEINTFRLNLIKILNLIHRIPFLFIKNLIIKFELML